MRKAMSLLCPVQEPPTTFPWLNSGHLAKTLHAQRQSGIHRSRRGLSLAFAAPNLRALRLCPLAAVGTLRLGVFALNPSSPFFPVRGQAQPAQKIDNDPALENSPHVRAAILVVSFLPFL